MSTPHTDGFSHSDGEMEVELAQYRNGVAYNSETERHEIHRHGAGGWNVPRRLLTASNKFANKITYSIWGELDGPSPDGTMDALGGSFRLRSTAASMLMPQDRVSFVRERDPTLLATAIEETRQECLLEGQNHWAHVSAQDAMLLLHTSIEFGLVNTLVESRLNEVGPNELSKGKKTPFFMVWVKHCGDMTTLIILLAGLILWFGTGDAPTGAIFLGCFTLSSLANAIGEYSNVEGLSALSSICAPTTRVIRDGNEQQISSSQLVPGDVVFLACGDLVPADMRVAVATDLTVDESVLTGEGLEVNKSAEPVLSDDPFPVNMLFSSTLCVGGKGIGVVTATGMKAQVGLIASRLDVNAVGLSPLQRSMNRLGGSVGFSVIIITAIITTLCYLVRYEDPARPCKEGDSSCFLFGALAQGLILGVSCVPATLPIMTNILLTIARREISKKNAIVRKTSAIETLGCCMAICTDKTGTLTEGKMTVVRLVTPRLDGTHKFAFYPTAGATPFGGLFRDSELGGLGQMQRREIEEVVRMAGVVGPTRFFSMADGALPAAASNAASNPLLKFPLRSFGRMGPNTDLDDVHVRALLIAASLNSYATSLQHVGDKWVTSGNLSEGALVVAAAKVGIGAASCSPNFLRLEDMSAEYPQVPEVEVPFSSQRKMMCTVHQLPNKSFAGILVNPESTHIAVVKGAPDRLLPVVENSLKSLSDRTLVLHRGFDPRLHESMIGENIDMASASLRVLLLCVRELTPQDLQELRSMDADSRMGLLIKNLAIVGAFGILDPPKAMVKDSILRCKSAGIRVVLITGDHVATAASVGLALDIVQDKSEARLCRDLYDEEGMLLPHDSIDLLVTSTNAWARAQPMDKVTIVESLQRMGLTAAMTGDGVNDAPALKLADIGTAMGITGTEVAKGAADIILMNDDFTTIVDAVQEGRRTYSNVQTYVSFYLTMSLPEVVTYATCTMMTLPMPLSPMQMMTLTGSAHIVAPLMLANQPPSPQSMEIPPRRTNSRLLTKNSICWLTLPWLLSWYVMWTSLVAVGVKMNTGFMYIPDIVGSHLHEAVKNGLATCEFAGVESVGAYGDRHYLRDEDAFHCKCYVRLHPFATPKVIDQWGLPLDSHPSKAGGVAAERAQRAARGLANLKLESARWSTPLYEKANFDVEELLTDCTVNGYKRWCWKGGPEGQPKQKPLLDRETMCSVLGTRTARAMSFLGVVVAELVLVLAFSSERPLLCSMFTNGPLSLCASCSLCFAVLLVYIPMVHPPLAAVTGMHPLPTATLLTTLGFAAAAHTVLDLCKMGYRWKEGKTMDLRRYHAKATARGWLPPHATNDEVRAFRQTHPLDTDLIESF